MIIYHIFIDYLYFRLKRKTSCTKLLKVGGSIDLFSSFSQYGWDKTIGHSREWIFNTINITRERYVLKKKKNHDEKVTWYSEVIESMVPTSMTHIVMRTMATQSTVHCVLLAAFSGFFFVKSIRNLYSGMKSGGSSSKTDIFHNHDNHDFVNRMLSFLVHLFLQLWQKYSFSIILWFPIMIF